MDLTGKTILDRYQVLSMLGEGAMGAVYLADDIDLKRQVALKVLRRELAARPDVVKRLANECQIMARLGPHANIVTLYDRLVHDGDVILVMEFVPGESLSALIDRTREMNTSTEAAKKTVALGGDTLPVMKTSDALDLADQCLSGLEFAHSKGVLHRDIKPENIMVMRDHNGRPQAKIMDFGIGKAISAGGELGSPMLTMVGGPGPGTPAYMAPEQIDPQRFGPVGPAADLYAFGVTLYQMLTLNLPFEGTYTELLNAHTNIEPPDPTLRNSAITPAIRAVLVKALRKNQQERYNSAAEFRMDLAAAGSGGGTMVLGTAPGGFSATSTKTSPGSRPGVGMPTPIPTPTTVPQAPASARRGWLLPALIGTILLMAASVAYLLLKPERSPGGKTTPSSDQVANTSATTTTSGSSSPSVSSATSSSLTSLSAASGAISTGSATSSSSQDSHADQAPIAQPPVSTQVPTPDPNIKISMLNSQFNARVKNHEPVDDALINDAKAAGQTELVAKMENYRATYIPTTSAPVASPTAPSGPKELTPEQMKILSNLDDEALNTREEVNALAKQQGKNVENISKWVEGVELHQQATRAHNKYDFETAEKKYRASQRSFANALDDLRKPPSNSSDIVNQAKNVWGTAEKN